MTRTPSWAPLSSLPPERRGRVLGPFCRACGSVYPQHALRHAGKPVAGRDHVGSPCAYEGNSFRSGAEWWEPAVEVLPAPAPSAVG